MHEYGNGYSTVYAPKCSHHGDSVVFVDKARGISLAAATGSAFQARFADLVIDCAYQYTPAAARARISGDFPAIEELQKFVKKEPRYIKIEWPDMGEPYVTGQFWVELYKRIPNNTRVVAVCVGGHGRSGTAITALLLCADSQATPSKAISLVRERHCKNAVESETQDLYLLEVWRTLLKNKGGLTDDEIDEMIEDEYDILNPPKKAAKVYDLRDTPVHVGSQKSLPVGTSSPNKGIIRFWRPEKSHVNTNAQGMLDSNRRCTLCGMTIVKYEHWFKSTAGFVYAGKTGDPGKIVDLCDLCVATLSGKEKASSVTPPSIIPYD